MKKLLIFTAAISCILLILCLCGCAVHKITTADEPQNSEDFVNDDNKFSDDLEEFTVTYVDGSTEIDKLNVQAGSLATDKDAPEKNYYKFAGWNYNGNLFDFETPIYSDVTLTAVYNPITYTATYKADDKIVAAVNYSVESKDYAPPVVPEKYGYIGEWESVNLEGDIVINANYIPVKYYANFIINGTVIDVVEFTIEDKLLTEPQLTPPPHYTAEWESYELTARDLTINAVFTPVTYNLTFISEGQQTVVPYTIENNDIIEPVPTQKEGYSVSWEPYSLTYSDSVVKADYKPIDYTITFVSNGKVVEVNTFNIENMEPPTLPSVPQRLGYEGRWQNFELNLNNLVVNAEYTLVFKDEFTYSLSKDKSYYSVTGYNGNENYLVVPAEHNGKPVKRISDSSFIANVNLTSVELCEGIEVIEDCAFMACTKLSTIILPESLTSIGNDAFADSGITELNVPENVQKIGNNAFYECTSLQSITIKGNTQIGEYAFSKCTALKSVDLGSKIENLGAKAFYNCTALEKIYIPSSLKLIETNAFYGCTTLGSVEFENCSGWAVEVNKTVLDICESDLTITSDAARLLTVIHVSKRWINQ